MDFARLKGRAQEAVHMLSQLRSGVAGIPVFQLGLSPEDVRKPSLLRRLLP
jgi:hypothetical protein